MCLTVFAHLVYDILESRITRGFLCGVSDHDHLSMPLPCPQTFQSVIVHTENTIKVWLAIVRTYERLHARTKSKTNMTCYRSHIRTIAHQKIKPKTNKLQPAIVRTYEWLHARTKSETNMTCNRLHIWMIARQKIKPKTNYNLTIASRQTGTMMSICPT